MNKQQQCIEQARQARLRIARTKGSYIQYLRLLLSKPEPADSSLRTFGDLWDRYGLDGRCHQYALVENWVSILYGAEAASGLKDRLNEISARRARVNIPYYEGTSATHFHLAQPVDTLIQELSGELLP